MSRSRHSCQNSDSLELVRCRCGSVELACLLDVQGWVLVRAMQVQVRAPSVLARRAGNGVCCEYALKLVF